MHQTRLTVQFLSPEGSQEAAIQILAGALQAEYQAPQNITACSTGVNIFKSSQNLPQAVKFNCPFTALYPSPWEQERTSGKTNSQGCLPASGDSLYDISWFCFMLCVLEVMPSSMSFR